MGSRSAVTKDRVVALSLGWSVLWCPIVHFSLLSFVVRNWTRFDTTHVPLMIVAIDVALLIEHVYTLKSMHGLYYKINHLRQKDVAQPRTAVDASGSECTV